MLIIGGFPDCIVFGPHGITPAQIAGGGNAASPLLNDIDLGDQATELLWRLQPPYLAVGVTVVTDTGVYALTGAPDGVHTQSYRLFALPETGAPYSATATISAAVGPFAVASVVGALESISGVVSVAAQSQAEFDASLDGLLGVAAVGTFTFGKPRGQVVLHPPLRAIGEGAT